VRGWPAGVGNLQADQGGGMLDITLTDYVSPYLLELEEHANNLAEPMHDIAQLMLESIDNNFAQEGRPEPWVPRVEPTGTWPLLQKTGNLRNSFYPIITETGVEIVSDAHYAEYLDRGTDRMVARPFFLIQDDDESKIVDILLDYIFPD
jgi:phage gpG-like protein